MLVPQARAKGLFENYFEQIAQSFPQIRLSLNEATPLNSTTLHNEVGPGRGAVDHPTYAVCVYTQTGLFESLHT
jgi:hypothetical protein